MHRFSNQFPIIQENATKPIFWRKPGKLVLILCLLYGCFFPIGFFSYGILHIYIGNPWFSLAISYSIVKCNRTHRTGTDWYSCFSHSMKNFSPWDSHPIVYFITLEMHRISHEFPVAWEKAAKPNGWVKLWKLVTGKILQNSSYAENLRKWYLYFSHNTVLFYHYLFVLWFTSSHGKCMGFLVNFQKYRKRQQNPSNRESLGNWFPHIFNKMGTFFLLDSHPVVHFIIWEMHEFSHHLSIAWEKLGKPFEWKKPWKLVHGKILKTHRIWRTWEIGTHTFHIVWVLFSN